MAIKIDINQIKDKEWIDYSSLTYFMTCPRKYFWRCQANVVVNKPQAALINGKVYHDVLAAYYTCMKDGASYEEARAVALGMLSGSDLVLIKDDPKRNLTVALETLYNYIEYWKNEQYKTIECEIGFAVDLGHFFYVGKIDRVADSPFGLMIIEQKTTSIVGERWMNRAKPNMQIDGYVGSYYITTGRMPYGGVLDVIHIHEDSKKRKSPFRIISARSNVDVDNWVKNISYWFNHVMRCKESQFYPMNNESCFPLMGFSCDYHTLCLQHPYIKLEEFNNIEIPSEFKIEKWQPWEIELSG